MPRYINAMTPSSPAYAALETGKLVFSGDTFILPPEYQPISQSISYKSNGLFIEPEIEATYFDMVDIRVGGEWVITDPQNKVQYPVRRVSKRHNRREGTISYTFKTYASRLSIVEPPSVMISSEDAGLGATANATEVMGWLFNHPFTDAWPGLQLGVLPELTIRGAAGEITPYVHFISMLQKGGNDNKSIREWLEELFACFPGYKFMLTGKRLDVIEPTYKQTEVIELLAEDVKSVTESVDDDNIINYQRVTSRPYAKSASVFDWRNDDGTMKEPSDLPEISNPVYYRQGETAKVPLPDNREFKPEGEPTKIRFTEDCFPITPPVRVIWTAYVFATHDFGGNTVGMRAYDLSEEIEMQTHVVDIGAGDYFDAVTRWVSGEHSAAWVWRLTLSEDGKQLAVDLVEPTGDATIEIPVNSNLFRNPLAPSFVAKMGAEFHLNILGQAWVRSEASFSGSYGHQAPAYLPTEAIGAAVPSIENRTDAAAETSWEERGQLSGGEIDTGAWSLFSGAVTDGEIRESWLNKPNPSFIVKPLVDIAQATVKARLTPPVNLTLETARPYKVGAAWMGRLIKYGAQIGELVGHSMSETHAMTGDDYSQVLEFEVRPDTVPDAVEIVEYEAPEGAPFTPPGYPEGGIVSPPAVEPPQTTYAIGTHEITGWQNPLHIMRVQFAGSGTARARLYRTEADMTADAARTVEIEPTQYMKMRLIGDWSVKAASATRTLDAFVPLAHTAGSYWLRVEGGAATFDLYMPQGQMQRGIV